MGNVFFKNNSTIFRAPQDYDHNAAWELYIELLTCLATQSLDDEHGDEKTALNSIFSLFDITRQVLKKSFY